MKCYFYRNRRSISSSRSCVNILMTKKIQGKCHWKNGLCSASVAPLCYWLILKASLYLDIFTKQKYKRGIYWENINSNINSIQKIAHGDHEKYVMKFGNSSPLPHRKFRIFGLPVVFALETKWRQYQGLTTINIDAKILDKTIQRVAKDVIRRNINGLSFLYINY